MTEHTTPGEAGAEAGRSESLVLSLDDAGATLGRAGGKGESLARLARAGLPVPPGFHLTTAAYRHFVGANHLQDVVVAAAGGASAENPAALDEAAAQIGALFASGTIPDDVAAAVRQAYRALAQRPDAGGADDVAVAVRSSATAEDLPGASFAGQQESFLNVRGADAVLDAVKRCWASLWTARAIGYRARQGVPPSEVSLAVVVQRLVPADASGVLFTAHPVSGARHQILINAAWGLGEAIVGGLVTPDSFVVDKATGVVVTQEIAEKVVMTERGSGGTRTAPVPEERRNVPALRPEQVTALARLGAQIEQLYGQPMDVEWALHDQQLFVVQARPITALPEPAGEAVPPQEWRLPNPRGRYFRSSVVELLPDPLSPLFAALALPEWNAAMVELGRRLGIPGVIPDDALTTIEGYAYYDFAFTFRQTLGSLKALIRLPGLMRSARARWEDEARPAYESVVRQWAAVDLAAAPATRLLQGARDIVAAAARHYLAIQSGVLPAAYMAEAAFTAAYDRLIKRAGDPPALTFLLGYDSAPIRAEQSLYDLAAWVRRQDGLPAYLAGTASAQVAAAAREVGGPEPPGVERDVWQAFQSRLAAHLARFGHAIYDLDFAKPVPADDPGPLIDTLTFFLDGRATNPHDRQATAAAGRERATDALLARLRGLRRALFQRLLAPAQRFAPLREDALADVGLGWPALRRLLREVGRRLTGAGAVAQPDDVYWLTLDELQAAASALDAGRPVPAHQLAVTGRRASWAQRRRVTPPVNLPVKGGATFLGIDVTRWLPARSTQEAGGVIKGTGTSPGRVGGVARVLRGPEDFGQMRPGDILVAKITTPAWTPLFALASGVVTDVGGPLSHSSIVAREYHIPAVLGTGVATERVRSGQRIVVDGDAGTVRLLD